MALPSFPRGPLYPILTPSSSISRSLYPFSIFSTTSIPLPLSIYKRSAVSVRPMGIGKKGKGRSKMYKWQGKKNQIKRTTKASKQAGARRENATQCSNANTHVNVLGQQVVGRLVLLDGVVVDGAGGERAAEEEAKEPIHTQSPSQPPRYQQKKREERRRNKRTPPSSPQQACSQSTAPRRRPRHSVWQATSQTRGWARRHGPWRAPPPRAGRGSSRPSLR